MGVPVEREAKKVQNKIDKNQKVGKGKEDDYNNIIIHIFIQLLEALLKHLFVTCHQKNEIEERGKEKDKIR